VIWADGASEAAPEIDAGWQPSRLRASRRYDASRPTKTLCFDDASDTEPMTFIASYLLVEGEDELIRML
jgi:hypothetical protein